LHLVLFENRERNKLLQTSVGFGFGFLFLVLHFLAIRAGIVLVYIGGLAICMHYFLRQKKNFLGGLTVLAFLVLPIVAYKTIPSFTKKINYSLYDFKQYQQGEGLNFSDSERMFGYEAALRLIQNQPILGTGIGDLKSEMKSSYKENLDMGLSKYPHNQYLFFLTGLGLLGLSFVLFALFYPIWKVGYREYFLFVLLQILFFISFMVENVLERSFGAVLYLTITLLTLTRALYLAELNASRANSPSSAEV
jgi:O-antigen ligase